MAKLGMIVRPKDQGGLGTIETKIMNGFGNMCKAQIILG
jgi:hypothetical protein